MKNDVQKTTAIMWVNENIRGITCASTPERAGAIYARVSGALAVLVQLEIITHDEREFYVEKGLRAVQDNAANS